MVLINNSVDHKVLEFQITDWNSYHETDPEDEKKYVIQLFGRTEDDKDVCIKVTDFTPYFYVQIPTNWKKKHVDKFVYYLKRKVSWTTNNNPNYACDLSNSLVNYKMVEKHNFYNFTKKKYFNFVMLVFKSQIAMREFSNVLARPLKTEGLTKEPMLYQRFESNIEPHIRCMHINNLSSCGWVTIDNKNLKNNSEYSNCDYSYSVQWKHIKPSSNDDRMAPLKIMGYDIECVSCDHNFPQADRETDKIIQIGITMYRYGSMECYEQYILTLKKCARIKGTNVECYKTEKGLIRGWAKKISEIRPDFKGGYNNFGFDDKYIFDRINRIDREEADRQGISVNELENRFLDEILNIMGKVNNVYLIENEGVNKLTDDSNTRQHEGIRKSLTYFEIKNLSSSALGDNELKFFQVPGIISVDMMKVIQRDHRLIGYKLDNVSANFITQKALRCVETGKNNDDENLDISIYTESTKALEKDSYIQIMVDDGYSSSPLCEGAKYKVIDIDGITETVYDENEKKNVTYSYQAIKTKISQKDTEQLREVLTNKLLRVYWTFAKDDMHHTLINKYFNEGDPKKIRQIAKYCIKDCKLVNLLLAKLEIIVNSVGMAKVCHVPLSYLFLRGQGVKIFSLVSKKCREKNFLIPVLRRNKKDNDGDDDNTYEGATVITPKPNVYLSPIGVLDYSSLYPNSMRERNLSPECYINDNKYDNLPGYIYHDVTIILKDKKGKIIRNLDGSPKKEHHRFAQELISDKQINTEMKDVFDKINKTMDNNIETILQQTYFTIKNIEDKIKKEKLITDSRIEDISFNDDFSTKKKAKLIEIEKIEMKNRLKIYLEIDEKIKEISIKKKLSIDNIDKSLDADQKSKEIGKIEKTYNENIKNVLEKYIISKEEREEMITMEREKATKSMNDEKSKVYNIVDGKMVRYGILPEILTELLNKRKETNGRLAVEKDSFVKAILNALQLAFKVTANSLYGQTGAPTSPIFFIAIAASTTAIGRERLHYARKMVEDNFPGSEVIYGDSVTGDTPIMIKDKNNNINIVTIKELGEKWKPYDIFKSHEINSNRKYKQQADFNGEVWTSNGWAKIKRVIRHKTVKKLYRVLTNTGCIDVTEDHSLLDTNKNIIKPIDCKIGTELLHGFPEINNNHNKLSLEIYKELDITSELFDCMIESNKKWNNEKMKAYFIGSEYRKQNKNISNEILNCSKKIKKYFLLGYLGNDKEYITNNKINAQIIYCLMKCLEYNIVIDLIESSYKLCIIDNINEPYCINKIIQLQDTSINGEYVYDLETESGTFHAGIGELIVKNTDSIFINFHIKDENGQERTDKEALIQTIAKCQRAAKLINQNVPKPQSIVYEKTFHPFILVAKKKYVGLLFETNPNKYFLKSMGIVLKRRDNAPIVKIVVGGIIDYILKNRDIDKAVEYTRNVLSKLMNGEYPIDKFIISKTLKSKYKKPSTIAHKVLADRMAIRDPGNKPQINDRIPFVYVVKDMGNKKKKDILQGDLIEHPDYVIQNNMKIDYLYYLEHQIIKPATQILELMIDSRSVNKLFDEYKITEENKRKGRRSILEFVPDSKKKNVIMNGSKTTKLVLKSQKNRKIEPKYQNLPYIGNTRKLECKNLGNWMYGDNVKQSSIDDGELDL
ncbi:B-family DNA polymerase [Acanthamoeba polyphaga mimivirus]|uniref:DNA-directed DNA polymerase n=5 Tax=Megamimivirinae TaxID=3044648 RepID=A0A2L2DMN8_MIMIV|nr:intein-containing DNA polymerase [Megavirus chiliensis]AEQ33130.1 B family exonuclease domain DNA polymerase [Megavirus chiliensis]AGW18168.1 DNA polymerase B-family [Mimivirus Shan]AVG46309.1 B-family DNA polymerase [Acanthamoeba polyphaga mimivirus]AVG47420.1 B-family DNA polymerase [Acanthamoeba polyphaga mimivirus]